MGLAIVAVLDVIVIPLVKAAFKAVFDVEVQDAWKDGAHPLIATAWSKATAVIEFINTFWGGALVTFGIVFCAEMFSLRRRRLAQMNIAVTAVASKERLAQIGRECIQLSRMTLKEHARITAKRIEAQQTVERLNPHLLTGFNWLQVQSDNAALTSEFSADLLVALHTLAIAGVHVPNFTNTENNYALNQPIEQTIQFYTVIIAQYLGAVGSALINDNMELAQHISKKWGRVDKGVSSADETPRLQSLQDIEVKIQQ